MAHQQGYESVPTSTLANSYGPEAAVDAGASGPQVVDEHQYGHGAYANDAPAEYYANANDKPAPTPKSPYQEQVEPQPERRKILGLSRTLFWVLAGLVALVIVGVGLGAGLGVGLGNSNRNTQTSSSPSSTPSPADQTTSRSPSSSPTSSSTTTAPSATFTPVTSGTTGLAANSCNFTQPQTQWIDGTAFTEYCYTDWPQGAETADGSGKVKDLMYTITYTFEACLEQCLEYNKNTDVNTTCQAVTYNSNLTSSVGGQGGNCFLKNKRGVNLQGSATSACGAMAY